MSADPLLSRLDKVKQTGPCKSVACCPAHDDRSPSLAVRELDDSRVLVHCFAGCATADVLHAVGLDFDSLYPERAVGHHLPPQWSPFSPAQALACVAKETMIVELCATDLQCGRALSEEDRARLQLAHSRIADAYRMGGAP